MKALETHQLLGLIVIIIIIILVIIIIVNPTLLFGGWSGQQTSFRDFCIQWSLRNYAEGLGEDVFRPYPPTPDSTNYGAPEEYCDDALGKFVITDEADIEKCRDVCRLKR